MALGDQGLLPGGQLGLWRETHRPLYTCLGQAEGCGGQGRGVWGASVKLCLLPDADPVLRFPAFRRPALGTQEAYKTTKQTARLAAGAWAGSQTHYRGCGGEPRATTPALLRRLWGSKRGCLLPTTPAPGTAEMPEGVRASGRPSQGPGEPRGRLDLDPQPGCLLNPGFTLRNE